MDLLIFLKEQRNQFCSHQFYLIKHLHYSLKLNFNNFNQITAIYFTMNYSSKTIMNYYEWFAGNYCVKFIENYLRIYTENYYFVKDIA
jgi:hypothetical protein